MDWSVAVPARPLAVPGATLSPGARTSTRVNAPPTMVTAAEVSGRIEGWIGSLTQMRCGPLRASRTGTSTWPAVSTVSAGITANASLEPSTTLSLTVLTTFQNWSTARTVAVNTEPALWLVGVPDLPLAVPGWTVSPGSRICIAANGPARTWNWLLEPVCGVVAKSEQVNE